MISCIIASYTQTGIRMLISVLQGKISVKAERIHIASYDLAKSFVIRIHLIILFNSRTRT